MHLRTETRIRQRGFADDARVIGSKRTASTIQISGVTTLGSSGAEREKNAELGDARATCPIEPRFPKFGAWYHM